VEIGAWDHAALPLGGADRHRPIVVSFEDSQPSSTWPLSDTSFTGDGCQSGPCLNGVTVDAPGPAPAPANANPGSFEVVGQSGVPVMHAALMPNDRAVFLDKVENYTQLTLSDGYYAYSSEYDPTSNQVVPLTYATNAFCSGGSFLAHGTLLNIGGNAPLSFIVRAWQSTQHGKMVCFCSDNGRWDNLCRFRQFEWSGSCSHSQQ
jgi:hypothetical protein